MDDCTTDDGAELVGDSADDGITTATGVDTHPDDELEIVVDDNALDLASEPSLDLVLAGATLSV